MAPLYELTSELAAVYAATDESGEMSPELEAYFDCLMEDEGKKLDGFVGLIRTLEAEAELANREAAEFARKAAARANRVAHLKARMLDHLHATGRVEAKTASGRKVKVVANGGKPSIEIPDPTAVPAEFQKAVYRPDMDRIRQQVEEGAVFPWAVRGERGSHLRIY